MEELETLSSKSLLGLRLGVFLFLEDNYERITSDGSVGEVEYMENGRGKYNIYIYNYVSEFE